MSTLLDVFYASISQCYRADIAAADVANVVVDRYADEYLTIDIALISHLFSFLPFLHSTARSNFLNSNWRKCFDLMLNTSIN